MPSYKELKMRKGKVNLTKLVAYGIGIKPTTYLKLMYTIYSGDDKYFVQHIAIFGRN